MKVCGPYRRKDGRQHVIIFNEGKRRTMSYPKYIMEQYLGRSLSSTETVDHIDRDFNNNNVSNLRVVDKVVHSKEDAKRVKLVCFNCKWCGKESHRQANQLNHNAKLLKAGPFCGRVCAGKYGAALQYGRTEGLKPQPKIPVEDREYYYKEKKL